MDNSIVFINPPGPSKLYRSSTCTYVSKANYIWQPQDFVTLSAHIPEEYDLRFIDCSINGIGDDEFFRLHLKEAPLLAVMSLSSIVYDRDIGFLRKFRKQHPRTKLLVMGDLFLEPVFWERAFEEGVDGLILNPMDNGLQEYIRTGTAQSPHLLLTGSDRKAAGHSKTGKPAAVSIGVPRHRIFLNRKYRFPFAKHYLYSTVSVQFGCVFQCNYCSQCKIPVTYRNHEEVGAELDQIYGLGVREIFFGDPSFGYPRDNAVPILKHMSRFREKVGWACYANPALLDREMLTLMRNAGCHTVIIGVEDADMQMLKDRYKRNLAEQTLLEFCRTCHELGIRICGDFIIGLNSDEAAVIRMVEFAKAIKLDFASFNVFTMLFGSILREQYVEEGKANPYTVGYDTSGAFGEGTEDLVRLKNMAVRKFYFRPSYMLRRVFSVSSIAEFRIQFEEMVQMARNAMPKNRGKAA